MRGLFDSNVLMAGAMGVLLLLASAVGRVTATNVTGWLGGMQARAERVSVEAPEPTNATVHASWLVR